LLRAIDQRLVQTDAPHRDAALAWEIRGNGAAGANETDPAKGERLLGIDLDAQLPQRIERIRHETFAASFVDRRLRRVGHNDIQSL
jgi:hypothetical protein